MVDTEDRYIKISKFRFLLMYHLRRDSNMENKVRFVIEEL